MSTEFDNYLRESLFFFPDVRKGKGCIRAQTNAALTKVDLDRVLSALQHTGRKVGIPT